MCDFKYIDSSFGFKVKKKCNKQSFYTIPNTRVNETMDLCQKHYNSWYNKYSITRWFKKKYLNHTFFKTI